MLPKILIIKELCSEILQYCYLKMELPSARRHISRMFANFEKQLGFRSEIKWRAFFVIGFFHTFGLCWSYLFAFPVKWQTIVLAFCIMYASALGLTAGAHRMWCHKCYKAALPLRIFLMLGFSSSGQNSIYDWVRDHRVHHKFSDTEADPHNINRGFTFAHIGWLMLKKNNLVLEKGRQVDMSDILQDPVAVFERKYSNLLSFFTCYLLPTTFNILVLGETWQCAVAWQCFIRVIVTLHSEMTVNSFAHMFGGKPYNKNINPTQNRFVSTVAIGEGWHNYHHMFPNDYKASETFDLLDGATFFIRTWAKLGLAWDLKEPTPELVRAVINKHANSENNVMRENDKFSEESISLSSTDNGYLHSRGTAALG